MFIVIELGTGLVIQFVLKQGRQEIKQGQFIYYVKHLGVKGCVKGSFLINLNIYKRFLKFNVQLIIAVLFYSLPYRFVTTRSMGQLLIKVSLSW